MSEDRKPLGRLTVRNKNTGVETTIGTFWPLGSDGNMSLALGQSAPSKTGSGSVSRMSYRCSAARRSVSFGGMGVLFTVVLAFIAQL